MVPAVGTLQFSCGLMIPAMAKAVRPVKYEIGKMAPAQGLNSTFLSSTPLLGMSSPSVTTQPGLTQQRPGTCTRTGHYRVSTRYGGQVVPWPLRAAFGVGLPHLVPSGLVGSEPGGSSKGLSPRHMHKTCK